MKKIPLTQGQYAIVDDENYDDLNQFKWYAAWAKNTNSFYASRIALKSETEGPRTISMHRSIMDAALGMQVDHINHVTIDNRQCNLRICTTSQNQMNRGKTANNKSGYKGVSRHKGDGKWRAQIQLNKKVIYLGLFIDKEEAALAYNKSSKKHHGEYAFQNNIKQDKGVNR